MANDRMGVRGFTLIELMVTISIAVVLMAVVVPSLTTFQRNAQLTSFANTMVASINAARGEAMKRGRDAVVIPLGGLDWKNGQLVFVDANNNRTYEEGTDILIYKNDKSVPDYLTVDPKSGSPAASPPYIRYDAQGYPKPAGSDSNNFTISISRSDVTGNEVFKQTRLLKGAVTGRLRVCTPTSASDAKCRESSTS